ncbi:ac150 [Sucra jujuba nucleopolyhedrovirus]|uniref:Ac150 n=1 Tax=Sucra jujuba nucleopolyhedrovirus TaxID=1563660 RepID=A0A097P8Z1_9ABAC|nr:ac150 [Sucra jujuba nucleopolyhedrovirus]AIU41297.1 ac150 [Sucra jujuba nucleopolyhedrovirus]
MQKSSYVHIITIIVVVVFVLYLFVFVKRKNNNDDGYIQQRCTFNDGYKTLPMANNCNGYYMCIGDVQLPQYCALNYSYSTTLKQCVPTKDNDCGTRPCNSVCSNI